MLQLRHDRRPAFGRDGADVWKTPPPGTELQTLTDWVEISRSPRAKRRVRARDFARSAAAPAGARSLRALRTVASNRDCASAPGGAVGTVC